MLQTKHCPKCKQTKPIADFHRSKGRNDGLTAYCKACCHNYSTQYRNVGRTVSKLKHIDKLNDSLDKIAEVVDHILTIKQQHLQSIIGGKLQTNG